MLRGQPLYRAYLALVAVCFFWGTTYLAIRMALESFPPLVLVSSRFLLSGSLMLAGARLLKARLPKGKELLLTMLNGVLILGIGNSCLAISELWIPSGMASLIITASPLWMVGIDALLPGGDRLRLATMAGILVGAMGVVLITAPQAVAASTGRHVWGAFLLLQLANFVWSLGSLLQRRMPALAHPIVSGAYQQLAAGLVTLPVALLAGGPPIVWNLRGVGALVYLALFGSIVGYSAYIYAMDKLPVALVSLYTYINPVVALWLGWLVYRESFGRMEAVGMAIIFVSVTIVKRSSPGLAAVEVD